VSNLALWVIVSTHELWVIVSNLALWVIVSTHVLWVMCLQCKEEFTQLLRETEDITSTTQLDEVRIQLANDPRYMQVPSEEKRQAWFDDYTQDLV